MLTFLCISTEGDMLDFMVITRETRGEVDDYLVKCTRQKEWSVLPINTTKPNKIGFTYE